VKRIVLFDCRRIFARVHHDTPTGIDRVDIRYLDYFLNDPDTLTVGVSMRSKTIRLYSAGPLREINRMVFKRWNQTGKFGLGDKVMLSLHEILAKSGDTVSRLRTRSRRRCIPVPLKKLVEKHPGVPVFYVNVSHHGQKDKFAEMFPLLKREIGAKEIFYVHDCIPLDFPETVQPIAPALHKTRMSIIARNADMVVTNSEYSKERFLHYAHEYGFAPPEPAVLHIGVEDSFIRRLQNATAADATEPYFVAIGTIEPRKNHLLLLDVWDKLIAAGGKVPQLRIIGRRGWVTELNSSYAERVEKMAPHVIETGNIPDTELIAQLMGARALLFPSFGEGWGMPLVESIVAGTPVIVSDIPAFREASQGLAEFLPPTDEAGWLAAIRRFADPADPAYDTARRQLSAFMPPTWDAQFRDFEAAYDRQFGSGAR